MASSCRTACSAICSRRSTRPRGRSTGSRSRREVTAMAPGYDGRLYILAFDHRGSFEKLVLGPGSDPTAEGDAARIRDAKSLIYEGLHRALAAGLPCEHAGVLVDEQYGAEVALRARADGAILAMPVEKS